MQCSKTVCSDAMFTGRNIKSDMAQNTDSNAKIRDIVRRNMTESAHRVIKERSGQGRKRKRFTSVKRAGRAEKAKKQPARGTNEKKTKNYIKRDIFS